MSATMTRMTRMTRMTMKIMTMLLLLLLIVQPEACVGVVAVATTVVNQELAGDVLIGVGVDCDNSTTNDEQQQCVQKVVVPPPYDEDETETETEADAEAEAEAEDDKYDYDYYDFEYYYDKYNGGGDDDNNDDDDEDDYNYIVMDLYIPPIQPGELQILEFMNDEAEAEAEAEDDKYDYDYDYYDFEYYYDKYNGGGDDDVNNANNNNVIVHEYIARVGLPLHFVPIMTQYIENIGLMDFILHTMLDDNDDGTSSNQLEPDDDIKFHEFHIKNMTSATATSKEIENNDITLTYDIYRPTSDWNSDMHWFSVADEMAFEHFIRALGHAGLDEVFDSIGRHYNLSSLDIIDVGLLAVTHCEEGKIHTDFQDGSGKGFDLLIGISSPEDSGPEFLVQNENDSYNSCNGEQPQPHRGEIHYKPEYGLLVGDGAYHGTNDCDYRAGTHVEDRIRITISIYFGEMTETHRWYSYYE